MMNDDRGSNWRKWDFHVHTPYSVLNNRFGILPEDDEGFDTFVQRLFTTAFEKDIWAVGITDYFSIDGYRKIREEYLSKPEVMERLFPNNDVREHAQHMFVFPILSLESIVL